MCRAQERYLVLKRIIDYNPDIYGIIFCRTKADTQEVAEKLMKDGYNADALHGDLTQTARDNVMQRFRLKAVRLLIATDVAARGIDVNCLTHVINYQLPDDPEVYTHRSGRTGRAQQKGISISILHQRETRRIHNLEKMLHREFHYQPIPMPIDVCKKQLFYQVGKLQKADTDLLNSSQFTADVLDEALKVLSYLSKEELLTHFLALEFNRFLSYYKDAKDLNVDKPAPKHRDDRKPNKREKEQQGKNRMIRLKINVGKRDGMSPKRFLALVNEVTHDRSIHIGNIDIAQNFTFFDIFPDQRRKLENGFAIYEDLYIQEVKGKRADKF